MMNYKIIIGHEAQQEIKEVVDWYENQKQGLGLEFFLEFERLSIKVSQNPKMYIEVFSPFRRALLVTFPYVMYYVANETEKLIEIVGFFHSHRNPEFVSRTIQNR